MDTLDTGSLSAPPNPSTIAERTGVYKDRVDEWVHTLSAAELWSQLNRVSVWFKLAAFAAFIASSFFVVGYFAGSLQVHQWTLEQWLHGLILGVPFTATLTMFQYFLYSSGNKKAAYSSALSFVVAAGFGIMTEIGQGMERQEYRVHQRSLESPVLQSALKAIENSTNPVMVLPLNRDAVSKLAQHRYELARCDRHLKTHGQWRVDKCVNYEQERIARYQALVDSDSVYREQQLSAQAGQTAQLLQTAKQLERDEKHYHAFIRFLHSLFGFSTYLSANFLLSLLLVMAFEYAFHYLGNFERDTKAALRLRGYEVKRFQQKPPPQQLNERPPAQRTQQNLYMPMQQVGFDPLRSAALQQPSNDGHIAEQSTPIRQPVAQHKRSAAANSAAPHSAKPAANNRDIGKTMPATIPSAFSHYLGKALATGTANTPQEVQRFLQDLHRQNVRPAETLYSTTNAETAGNRRTRTVPTVGNSESGESEFGCSESVRGECTPSSSIPSVIAQQCAENTDTGQIVLPAELQSAVDRLYPLWKQQILRQQIKPTFRPGKALLNLHLCRDKRRQTPTPLELDNMTQQWLERGLKEEIILPNQQQGRGHARYVVNPDKILI